MGDWGIDAWGGEQHVNGGSICDFYYLNGRRRRVKVSPEQYRAQILTTRDGRRWRRGTDQDHYPYWSEMK